MKILILDSLIGNDYTINLCKGLGQLVNNITLILPTNRQGLEIEGINVKFWSPSKDKSIKKYKKIIKYFFYWKKIFALLGIKRDSIIHFQFFRRNFDLVFLIILRLIGIKIIYTAHNVFPHERKTLDFIKSYLVLKASHKIIVHSEYIKNKILHRFKFRSNKIYVIPHGNFDNYLPKELITESKARDYLGIPQKALVLLFFGYIREYKGADILIDAFELSIQEESNLYLLIGGAPYNKKLHDDLLNRIALSKNKSRIFVNFKFVSNSEVPYYFLSSNIVILPYKSIDHSGVIHLAYSFSRPVIASDVGDFKEVIEDNISGKIYHPNTSKNLSEAIIDMVRNYNLVKIGLAGKKLSEEKYSWKNIAERTLQVYSD